MTEPRRGTHLALALALAGLCACKKPATAAVDAAPAAPRVDAAPHAAAPVDKKELPMIRVTAVVDGTDQIWTEENLATLEPLVMGDEQGDRDAFSLKALVKQQLGDTARVTRVEGGEGAAIDIAPTAWADPNVNPVLKLNKRGMLKLHWLDAKGGTAMGDEVRGVNRLVVTTK